MSTFRIFKGDSRTVLIKKNIAGSFLIKGWSCIIQFLLIPLILKCLTQYEYGIWATIYSILIWVDYFDIGLGNGLRNKLAEAMATNNLARAKRLTSTTFLMLGIIIIPVLGLLIAVVKNIDCYAVFNVSPDLIPNLREILYVSIIIVGVTFIFKFIGNIYLGLQMPAVNNLLLAAGRTLSLIGIGILVYSDVHSLLHVAVVYTITPLIIYLIAYPVTFHHYPFLRPSFKSFDFKELKGLYYLGIKFFLVQIGGALIFASSNLLISNIVSPSEVTPYQISYYYFNIPLIIFTIINTPIWSATTDAYTKGDWKWIYKMEQKMRLIMIFTFSLVILMIIISPFVYQLWIGNKVNISIVLSTLMGIYVVVLIFSLCYSNILYGIGKIWLSTIITVIEALIFIPIAFVFGYKYGVTGIIASLIFVNSLCAVTNYIQYQKISRKTATGIWNR